MKVSVLIAWTSVFAGNLSGGKGTIIGKNKEKYWFIALQNEFLKAQILLEN